MKPAPFDFQRPSELSEVLALLGEHGDEAVVLAGGQSLTPLLNLRMARPGIVVDINRVGELQTTDVSNGHVRVGATARARTVELDAAIHDRLPLLRDALRFVGHPQIRNRGTVGGMVAFGDPAAEIPAVLLACGGQVQLRSARGERSVDAADFFTGFYTTARTDDELVTSVDFDVPDGFVFNVSEHSRRHGDYALAGVVHGARIEGDSFGELRLCLFGVGAGPVRLADIEEQFAGAPANAETIDAIGAAVEGALNPPADVHGSARYRRRVAGVMTRRALTAITTGGER